MARQPRAWCVEATRDCRPLWPVWQARPSPGWYGHLMGISTVAAAVKAVSRNLMNERENLKNFRAFVMAGTFRGPTGRRRRRSARAAHKRGSETRRQVGQPLG
jgi:hypothetical protein